MKRTRHYSARGMAPGIDAILAARREGLALSEIAATHGVHRRTVYAAVDRAADEGRLAILDVPVVFEDPMSRRRLAKRIEAAHLAGIPVIGWTPVVAAGYAELEARRAEKRRLRDKATLAAS